MLKAFHQTAMEIAINAMPADFQEKFLAGFSLDLAKELVDVPYVTDRYGEPEHLHLDHSFKLYLKGRDLHHVGESNAIEEVVQFAKSIHEFAKDGNGQLIRYNICRAAHLVTDIGTYPHVVETLFDKYHGKFEVLSAEWLEYHKHLVEELVKNYTPDPMRSVPNRVRAIAERAYFDSMEYLPRFKRNGIITDLMWATMCVVMVQDLMDWLSTWEKQL